MTSRAPETVGDLARTIVGRQLARMRRHEAGTVDGADPEDLHDMRVASRRLRAALRAFRSECPPKTRARLVRGLRWLGRALGPVRDLDVQIERLAGRGAFPRGSDHRAARSFLRARLVSDRERSRRRLVQALGGSRYRALIALLERYAASPAIGAGSIAAFGERALGKARSRFRKAIEAALSQPTAKRLHEARIRAKRLRYLLEFLDEAAGGACRAPARRLASLQDLLGAHQDAVVGREIARRASKRRRRRPGEAERRGLAARIAREEERAAVLRDRFVGEWDRFAGAPLDREMRVAVERLRRAKKNGDAVSGVP